MQPGKLIVLSFIYLSLLNSNEKVPIFLESSLNNHFTVDQKHDNQENSNFFKMLRTAMAPRIPIVKIVLTKLRISSTKV